MKSKDLANLLMRYPDFDVKFSFCNGFDVFPDIRSFDIIGIGDIGHSDKVIVLDGDERQGD